MLSSECGLSMLAALAGALALPLCGGELSAFQLPPKSVFSAEMPRYPNLWFYVDASLASTYDDAVKLMTSNLRESMHLREYYGPFGNPEGCDFEVRVEHLQPWEDRRHRSEQHSHAFHMRYYYSDLEQSNLHRMKLSLSGPASDFYRFGASAHYEVEHTNPNHADVEICPICGRTGQYKDLRGNLVELVHDPLGVELVLSGTIRGEVVRFDNFPDIRVGSVEGLRDKFNVRKYLFPANTGDRNTLQIGIVVISPH